MIDSELIIWCKEDAPLGSSLQHATPAALHEAKHIVSAKGALLLRGYEIDTAEKFAQAVSRFGGKALPYVDGTSPRTRMKGNVYSSTDYPADASIPLHNELSYSATWPRTLSFCCVSPPSSGGHTVLAHSAAILRNLDRSVRAAFKTCGVRYVRNLHGGLGFGLSWQQAFMTHDRAAVDAHCRAAGVSVNWKADGGLQLISMRPATAWHPLTGTEVWFNQADLFHPSAHPPALQAALEDLYGDQTDALPQTASFGDGSPIPLGMLEHIREVSVRHAIYFDWQMGDLLVIDNMLTSHGRSPFTGDRKIFVQMTS